ncbi:MAG: glycosyltransferase [Anaerolineaceae bacterium]|nr:glycosyltransferase [Anaerolineaceae bacterium]
MSQAIHQVIGKSSPGYSVSDYALALQDALQSWGYASTIFASEVDPTLGSRVRPLRSYKSQANDLLILHYALANEVTDWVKTFDVPLIFCYHNVTPPHFFTGVGGTLQQASQRGEAELKQFATRARLTLTYSQFSAQALEAAGFHNIHVLPLIMPTTLQQLTPDHRVQKKPGTNLLFVGRIAPNKRCEDILKVLYVYRQIDPQAHLFLVGARRYVPVYAAWLKELIERFQLQDAVTFTGHVSFEALAAYYRTADVYISMSEHEGFGIPLVESMRFNLPVIAYDCTAVPEVLGSSGVLIKQKRFDVIAELIHQIQTDTDLKQKIIWQQQQQVQKFAPERVLEQMHTLIELVVNP